MWRCGGYHPTCMAPWWQLFVAAVLKRPPATHSRDVRLTPAALAAPSFSTLLTYLDSCCCLYCTLLAPVGWPGTPPCAMPLLNLLTPNLPLLPTTGPGILYISVRGLLLLGRSLLQAFPQLAAAASMLGSVLEQLSIWIKGGGG